MIPYGRQSINENDKKAVLETLQSPFLTTGPKVEEFEQKLCEYTGAKYAVALSSGTAALHVASLILLKQGDLVLTTPNSFVATSNSIVYANAKPVFIDIKEDGNIDLDKCIQTLEKFQGRIKALYAVHFSGNPVEMEKLKYIKEKFNITILEDACHALGAEYLHGKIGNCKFSDITIFSFHPVKHITTAEGGAILTNNEKIYKKAKILRNHGIVKNSFINLDMAYDKKGNLNPWYYEMQYLGFNYRISDIQCALGISQLSRLDKFVKKRRQIAQSYDNAFKDSIVKPLYTYNPNSAYHLYVAKIDFEKLKITKAELFYKMRENNIALQLHYIPINKQPFYQNLGYGNENLPNMYRYYEEAFSLPIYPDLTESQQQYVIQKLFEIIN